MMPRVTRVRFPKAIRLPHDAYANGENVFHITIRAAIESAPFEDKALAASVWELVVNERERGRVRMLAACLMPDHLHMLLAPAGVDLVKWVDGFKSFSTRVSWNVRRGVLWQPGFHDRRMRDEREMLAAVRYILDNPYAAGLIERDGVWRYSGCWVEGWE